MIAGDIYSITLHGELIGEQTRNVFFYRVQAMDGPIALPVTSVLDAMAREFWQTALEPHYKPLAGTQMEFHTIRVYNLFNVAELYEGDASGELPDAGSVAGESLPPFAAYGFSQPSSIRGVRRGQKRLGGVKEVQQNQGAFDGGVFAQMVLIATDLGLPLTVPLGDDNEATLFPVIVKRVKEVDEETEEVSYRLPETAAEATWYPAQSWVPYGNVTTQNTRKFGRGI